MTWICFAGSPGLVSYCGSTLFFNFEMAFGALPPLLMIRCSISYLPFALNSSRSGGFMAHWCLFPLGCWLDGLLFFGLFALLSFPLLAAEPVDWGSRYSNPGNTLVAVPPPFIAFPWVNMPVARPPSPLPPL